MPWCPRCDEVFPEGPRCPRCNSSLTDDPEAGRAFELPSAGQLPQLKVPRRLRRAFGRRSVESPPPRSVLALALACLLFAAGFLVGRMASLAPETPAIVGLSAQPLGISTDGSVAYVMRVPSPGDDPGLVRHDLETGDIERVARFTLPFGAGGTARSHPRIVTSGPNVAIVVGDHQAGTFVGAFGEGRVFPLWLDGVAAAWESRTTLLVRDAEGSVTRWTMDGDLRDERLPGDWADLLPATGAAILVGADDVSRFLAVASPSGPRRTIPVPDDTILLAASPDGRRALLEVDGEAALWDGQTSKPLRADRHRAVAGAFSADSTRVAVTLIERGRPNGSTPVWLGVADASGRVAFDRVTTWADGEGCEATPAWGSSGRWVYLAPGDGSVYAIEAGGAPPRGTATRLLGCGVGFAG